MKELIEIQKKLKAPKDVINTFASFNYRTVAGILEVLKPLAHDLGCYIIIDNDLVCLNNNVYVKSTVTLFKSETEKISCTAYAKEPKDAKPKMDTSQTTGSTTTYANKYALSGLFLLDDSSDDPDRMKPVEPQQQPSNYTTSNQQSINDANDLPWLNKDKGEWGAIVNKIYSKTSDPDFNIETIIKSLRSKYKISKATAQELRNA